MAIRSDRGREASVFRNGAVSLWLVVALCASGAARGQAAEYQGLNGSITLGATQWSVDDSTFSTRFAAGLTAGYRVRLPWERRITLTPHVALTMTRFAGIKLRTNEVGFSRVELGVQGAAELGPVRPYVLWRFGRGTMERMVGDEAANFYGRGSGWGAGIEVPLPNVCANAIDFAWHYSAGSFDTVETRGGLVRPPMPYRATFVTIGWSGRFRGTRLLFACL